MTASTTTTTLRTPRHPLVENALSLARRWCAGHIIDARPALSHAVRVAATLEKHLPTVATALTAAALLHDAPEFAPPQVQLYRLLDAKFGPEVARIVRALHAEHHALDTGTPITAVDDRPVLLISTADKIVALESLAARADAHGDRVGFFATRPALRALLPHLHQFRDAGTGRVPASMTRHLGCVLDAVIERTSR